MSIAHTNLQPELTPHLTRNYRRLPISFVRGKGCYLYDAAGREYLDAFAGVAVSSLGHAHPKLVEAIATQCATLIHVSNHYQIAAQEEIAARLAAVGFPGRAVFGNSGTEANEAAYKVTRLWANRVHAGKKHRIIAFQGGFHGRTIGALSLTWQPSYREPFDPLPKTDFLPYGDSDALTSRFGSDVAAVVVEPIQGEGGVNVPPADFLRTIRKLCDEHEALMICDEVQTGIGRTGYVFGFEHDAVMPDAITLAKGLGGGVPIGIAMFGPKCADLLEPGMHGSTFGGNLLACAAAKVVLGEVTDERSGLLANVAARGAQLSEGLRRIFGGSVEVRGRGLLWGVAIPYDNRQFMLTCFECGLAVGVAANNTLRLAPPLIVSEREVGELLERLAAAVALMQR